MSSKPQNNVPRSGFLRKPSKKPSQTTDSLIESLRSISGGASDSLKEDLFKGIPEDFLSQMFGQEKPKARASGDLIPGQTLEFSQALEDQKEENKVLKAKFTHESQLRTQMENQNKQKTQELKLEMQAVMQEVSALAISTTQLSYETQVAALQSPVNPGVYHVIFFEKLRETIQSFRKKINNAVVWIQASNKRAQKKQGFWGQVSKSGAKRLLSQEDYIQRSAG